MHISSILIVKNIFKDITIHLQHHFETIIIIKSIRSMNRYVYIFTNLFIFTYVTQHIIHVQIYPSYIVRDT